MGEVLIKAEGVSKKFAKNLKKSLAYGFSDLVYGILGKNTKQDLRKDEFWAVKDVSFEVRRGECLGLIGHNGAGKSTLLKMLNGIIAPDEGTITMHGKIGALIELGAGFNPILTGRENIYNNGAVIGFSKEEINAKLEEIIAFAELEEFIDMPVKNYSSGMRVRLGFAIAAQMEPDILLIDEVLAVGDLGFVLKCFKRIDTILPHTAIIFVSHSMPMVSRICNEIILMERGEVLFQGKEVVSGISLYYGKFNDSDSTEIFNDNRIEITDFKLTNKIINRKENLNLSFKMQKKIEFSFTPKIYIEFKDKEQRPIAGSIIIDSNESLVDKIIHINIEIKNLLFSNGIYFMDLSLKDNNNSPMLRINNICNFQIKSNNEMWVPFELDATHKIELT